MSNKHPTSHPSFLLVVTLLTLAATTAGAVTEALRTEGALRTRGALQSKATNLGDEPWMKKKAMQSTYISKKVASSKYQSKVCVSWQSVDKCY